MELSIHGPGQLLIKRALNLAQKIVVVISISPGGINSASIYPH